MDHPISGPSLADFGLSAPAEEAAEINFAPLQSLELFAGGGGMALGMRAAGFHHHALVEWWAPAARVLRHNAELRPELWKPDQILEDDVRKVVNDLGEPGTVQLIAGGPALPAILFRWRTCGRQRRPKYVPSSP